MVPVAPGSVVGSPAYSSKGGGLGGGVGDGGAVSAALTSSKVLPGATLARPAKWSSLPPFGEGDLDGASGDGGRSLEAVVGGRDGHLRHGQIVRR